MASNVKLTKNDYTVGWICALHFELAASQGMLHMVHQDLDRAEGDKNIYTLGQIWNHNVVIACLPSGAMGITPAAKVASDMLRSFPRIRFGLLVGIGGGAPSPNILLGKDIRLGDVVVSIPDRELGGVVKYKSGKVVAGGEFEHTGLLNMPPALLTNAVAKLRGIHEFKRNAVSRYVSEMVKKMSESEDVNPDFEDKYQYQGWEYDQLFEADYEHEEFKQIFDTSTKSQDTSGKVPDDPKLPCPNCDKARLVPRKPRRTNDPVIHYGTIASDDIVMRHGTTREKIRKKYGVLCFEMEAAGLMNDFPCLVIRGICDYSDTHKYKLWQRYAAATAAAYAKELLELIPNEEVEMTDEAVKVLKGQQQQERDKILDWLDPDTHTEKFADSLQKWQRGTGRHFLDSEEFLNWANKNTQTLWFRGIHGAGKTILASVVIEHLKDAQREKEPANKAGVACLYCEHGRQEDQTPHFLLAAVLRQLADQHTLLPESVTKLYHSYIINKTRHNFVDILETLPNVIQGFSQVFLVVDALDECSEESCRDLLSELRYLQNITGMKLLATSRHTVNFREIFKECALLEIKANKCDIIAVLEVQVENLSACVRTDSELRNRVKEDIAKAVDGMFVLAMPFLESLKGKRTSGAVESALNALLESPDKLLTVYDDSIKRIDSQNQDDRETAHRVLSWIVHAKRLLKCQELLHALAVRIDSQDLDIPPLEEVVALCAGLVVINQKSNTVQLMHDTTRIYFEDCKHQPDWILNAPATIASTCLTYVSFDAFRSGQSPTDKHFEARLAYYPFLDYAARYWGEHARKVQESVEKLALAFLISKLLVLCSHQAMSVSPYQFTRYSQDISANVTGSHLAAGFGLEKILEILLKDNDIEADSKDSRGRTPLSYAAEKGHEAVVKLLLEKGAKLETTDRNGWTPLLWAASNGHKAVVKLLLENGAELETKDKYVRTPLSLATEKGHEAVVKLLLDRGAELETKDRRHSRTPLIYAAEKGHEAVVKLLLEKGAKLETKDKRYSQTPLSLAAEKGHEAVVKLLLEKGAQLETKDNNSQTPLSLSAYSRHEAYGWMLLSYAAENGHEAVVKLLLEKGAKLETKDYSSQTPLSLAAGDGRKAVVKLLLEKGAELETKDNNGQTPLSWAAKKGHEAVVKLLLEKGAKLETKDKRYSQTPLSLAAYSGHEAVVKLLLERGAQLETKDDDSQTPLSLAAYSGREAVVRLLLEKGAELETKDNNGQTPLSWAAEKGHEAVVKLLLEKGAKLETKDKRYIQTPLSLAAYSGHEAVVKLLLEKGAELETKDNNSQTPLSWAAEKGHEAVVKLLLEKGAQLETKDNDSQTPLSLAAYSGHEAVVRLLLEKGAELETKDKNGWTLLSYAARYGYEAVVKLLLEKGAKLKTKYNDGFLPLSWAASRGHEAVVKLLLEKGAELATKSRSGQNLLSYATENGHEAVVKLLLEKGAELETKNIDGFLPLSCAASMGHKAVVKLLLEKGAQLETKDNDSQTPLSLAAYSGHEAVVRLLLEKGAELETKDKNGRTPLLYAAWDGRKAVVKLLLEKGAELETKDNSGQTPLSYAAYSGQKVVVRLLLEKGAELETKDNNGLTPLSWAADSGHEAVVRLLLEKGAELETESNNGQTPLSLAADSGHEAAVRLLLEKGAELETKDKDGWTPLSYAVENGQKAVVRLLLEKGAELETESNDGQTPLLLAVDSGHQAEEDKADFASGCKI